MRSVKSLMRCAGLGVATAHSSVTGIMASNLRRSRSVLSCTTDERTSANALIGSYETYDDELYGTKTFFSFSLLVKRPAETEAVRTAIGSLQAFEDALPYASKKQVREVEKLFQVSATFFG